MVNKNHKDLNPYPLKLFSLPNGTHQNLADKVAKLLKKEISPVFEKVFANGEFLIHHTESIRDRDVYIIAQPRFGNKEELASDLEEYYSLVYALRQGEPIRITTIIPSLPYARQDRASNHREPILSQKVPMHLQMAGAYRLVVLKMHNPSSYNAHPATMPIVDVDTTDLFIEHIKNKKINLKNVKIVAPDMGAAGFCRQFADKLGIRDSIVIVNKFRDPNKANHNEVMEVIGDAKGYDCIILDDMADTCGTAVKCLKVLKESGAKKVYFGATHAVLSKDAVNLLNSVDFSGIWFTDSCLREEDAKKLKNLEVISTAKILAQVIDNLYNGHSVTELWHGKK